VSEFFAELYRSGRVIDLVLVVLATEGAVLVGLHRWRGGLSPLDVFGHLSAGLFLLLALRTALTDLHWGWTGLFLTLSLPAHLFDLFRRWRAAVARARPGA